MIEIDDLAKVVKAVVNKALQKLKVDDHLTNSHAGGFVEKVSPGGRPSRIVGGVAFWLIFLFALSAAIGALKIPAVTSFMDQVLAYLPNVIAAVVIFVVASVIAALLGMLALAGALAFGLGGRDVAAQLLQSAYESGQDAKGQAKADARKGKQRAKAQADDAYPDEAASTGSRANSRTSA